MLQGLHTLELPERWCTTCHQTGQTARRLEYATLTQEVRLSTQACITMCITTRNTQTHTHTSHLPHALPSLPTNMNTHHNITTIRVYKFEQKYSHSLYKYSHVHEHMHIHTHRHAHTHTLSHWMSLCYTLGTRLSTSPPASTVGSTVTISDQCERKNVAAAWDVCGKHIYHDELNHRDKKSLQKYKCCNMSQYKLWYMIFWFLALLQHASIRICCKPKHYILKSDYLMNQFASQNTTF